MMVIRDLFARETEKLLFNIDKETAMIKESSWWIGAEKTIGYFKHLFPKPFSSSLDVKISANR